MMKNKLLGFDIGGTKCAVCLGDASGRPLDKVKFSTLKGFEENWRNLCQAVHDILEANRLSLDNIAAIGISCGGPLDSAAGVILSPPNLSGWNKVPIVRLVEKEFNIPAFLMNDANACALAEWQFGAGQGAENMVFLTMGTGLGGGLILNNRLHEGASGMSGEIGHIRLRPDGPTGFGKSGSFEGFCGGNGIAGHAKLTAANYEEQKSVNEYLRIIGSADFSVKNLDIAQAEGNQFALDMFAETGKMLGEGLAVIIDMLNPDKIIIGSIFERSEHLLRPAMEKVLRQECLPESLECCQILPAALGDKIGDYACLLVGRYGLEQQNNNSFHQSVKLSSGVEDVLTELLNAYPVLNDFRNDISEIFALLVTVFTASGKLLICGNGGSAADAQHIVGELMKDFTIKRGIAAEDGQNLREMFPDGSGDALSSALTRGLPAISLSGELALNTALSNDVGDEYNFAQQVYGLCVTGDALLALSTSGNSANVVNAVKTAKCKGAVTLGITGMNNSALSELCDKTIQLPETETYRVQELTLPVYHALCRMLELHFFT